MRTTRNLHLAGFDGLMTKTIVTVDRLLYDAHFVVTSGGSIRSPKPPAAEASDPTMAEPPAAVLLATSRQNRWPPTGRARWLDIRYGAEGRVQTEKPLWGWRGRGVRDDRKGHRGREFESADPAATSPLKFWF